MELAIAFLGCLLAFALSAVAAYTYVMHVAVPRIMRSAIATGIVPASPPGPGISRAQADAALARMQAVAADNDALRAYNATLSDRIGELHKLVDEQSAIIAQYQERLRRAGHVPA